MKTLYVKGNTMGNTNFDRVMYIQYSEKRSLKGDILIILLAARCHKDKEPMVREIVRG